jgi:hypothetical protein
MYVLETFLRFLGLPRPLAQILRRHTSNRHTYGQQNVQASSLLLADVVLTDANGLKKRAHKIPAERKDPPDLLCSLRFLPLPGTPAIAPSSLTHFRRLRVPWPLLPAPFPARPSLARMGRQQSCVILPVKDCSQVA